MHLSKTSLTTLGPALGLVAFSFGVIAPAAAQTVISGHHDQGNGGLSNGDGYDAGGGTFTVGTDTVGPSATFNGNANVGLYTFQASVTVSGGQYSNDGAFGLDDYYQSSANVTGGLFSGDASGLRVDYQCTAIVSGGTFSGNGLAIDVEPYDTVTVTGGLFSGSTQADFLATHDAAMDLYGQFVNPVTGLAMTPGQSVALPSTPSTQGNFTGRLQFGGATAQVFSYLNSGTITLHDVAPAPEPSQTAALVVGVLGLAALGIRARRRAAKRDA